LTARFVLDILQAVVNTGGFEMEHLKLSSFRPDKDGVKKALGDLEAEVMELMWERGEASVRDIHAALEKTREIAYTTVMTVMGRLAEKGLLIKEREGKLYRYHPSITKDDFSRSFIGSILSGLCKGLTGPALAYFVDHLAEEDEKIFQELEKLIQEKRKKL